MDEIIPREARKEHITQDAGALMAQIRASLVITRELLDRVLAENHQPNLLLAALLESTANRYIDFSERVNQALQFTD